MLIDALFLILAILVVVIAVIFVVEITFFVYMIRLVDRKPEKAADLAFSAMGLSSLWDEIKAK